MNFISDLYVNTIAIIAVLIKVLYNRKNYANNNNVIRVYKNFYNKIIIKL